MYSPEHVITNQEPGASYNRWADQYNDEHSQEIGKGELEAKPRSSVDFIIEASGIQQRYAYVKEGILDIGRMRPLIPEGPEEALSNQAEISIQAARDAIKAADKSATASVHFF